MYDNFLRKTTTFMIVIYARLSKEEKDKQNPQEQSQSIRNQIELCHDYIEEEKKEYPGCNFSIVEELYDDGISGTTFNRNSFNKLLELIKTKQVNMVITKDLSRLGRDHIETDNYIERWFPEHNVRYVSILDGVDTFKDNTNNDIAPIKNWINDMYAKDTSRKVKRQFQKMIKEGLWTGGEPPLGYKIDPFNKNKFIIDTKGAEVVTKIFSLAKENKSLDEIANILIKNKVPIPTLIKGNKRILQKDLIEIWSKDTIKNILQNEMYLGHMIQGKTTKLSYKSKKIISLPKKDWIKVENTHPPIIDNQTFNIVQSLIKTNKNKTTNSYNYLLKGLLKCTECNHSIGIQHYKNRKYNYTICNYYKKYGNKKRLCTSHRLIYENVERLVLENIKHLLLNFIDKENLVIKLKELNNTNNSNNLNYKIESCIKEIRKLNTHLDMIYEDKLNNIIDETEYKRRIKTKKENLEYETNNLIALQKQSKKVSNNYTINYLKYINEFLELNNPNKIIITKLINKITISENGTIDIYYNIKI